MAIFERSGGQVWSVESSRLVSIGVVANSGAWGVVALPTRETVVGSSRWDRRRATGCRWRPCASRSQHSLHSTSLSVSMAELQGQRPCQFNRLLDHDDRAVASACTAKPANAPRFAGCAESRGQRWGLLHLESGLLLCYRRAAARIGNPAQSPDAAALYSRAMGGGLWKLAFAHSHRDHQRRIDTS